MLIKVCGMRDPENIREVEKLDIDMMGMIFHKGSSRFVASLPHYLPGKVKEWAFFVNESKRRY